MMGKPEGIRQFGRLGVDGGNNIKVHLKGTEWEGADWIPLTQDTDQELTLLNTDFG
jgi:hypothetical protein